jgi:hypothetical protein
MQTKNSKGQALAPLVLFGCAMITLLLTCRPTLYLRNRYGLDHWPVDLLVIAFVLYWGVRLYCNFMRPWQPRSLERTAKSVKYFTHGWRHLGLRVCPPAQSLTTAMKAAKMTNDIEEETKAVPEENKWSSVGALQDDELDLATGRMSAAGGS